MLAIELEDGAVWVFHKVPERSGVRATRYVAECVWHPSWAQE